MIKQSGNERKQKWQEFGSRRDTMGPKGDGRINTMCKIEEEIKEAEETNTQITSDVKKNKECLDDFGKGELSDRYELEGKLVETKAQLESLEAEKETWKEEKKEMEYERD